MKRFLKSSALVALAAVLPWSAKAAAPYTIPKFRLNQYYDSNAVLQRGVTLPICGTAAFGDTVTVTFNGQSKTATANIETAWTAEGGEGRWTVDFPAMEAGGPYTLTVTDGTKTLTATNILIGDVWHVAGQSNSYYPIERFTEDADEWLKDADYPEVRFIEPNSATTGHMQHLLNQDYWYPLSSATAGKCSALGFFFVKELRKTVNVPMGIINSAADGTAIDNWIPSTTKNGYASKMLNDLEPMVPFPVKGVLWYQGETDGMFAKGKQYRYELQKLVQQWRAAWNDADMPFLVPQLPFYNLYDEKWAEVRLSQNWTAAHESNVHVVSTLDLSDLANIHPRTKPELGARLSLFARKYLYGEAGIYPDGPIYKSCEVNPSDSTELLVHFDVHGSITSRDGQAPKGFKVGGIRSGTRQYYDATVRIVNDTTLGLKNANITSPDSVRYGCHNIEPSSVNFFDSLGFPARAFSSEDEAGGGDDDDDDDDDDDPDHVHGWKFTLSGSVLTAVCTNAGCTAGTPTLSISGGDTKSYDGSPLKVSLTGDDLAARTVSQIGPIEYYQNDEKLSGAPTAVGVYEARVQVIHDSDIYVLKKTLTIGEAEETLQSRIDAAVPGGTVVLGEGTFVINAQLNVTGGVKLVGAGWDKTTISPDSGLNIRCVYVDGGATVEGMTLTGGNADLGSGAWIKNGTVSWCKLINNSASVANCHGVGVSFTEGQGQVDHCIIAGNSGWVGTSGIGIGATGPTGAITIDTCLIYGNKTWSTTGSGAAIGIYNHDFDCTVRNCTIVGNTANLYGAVYRQSGTGKLILINDIVVGNFLFNGTEANVKNATANETKNCLFGLASEIQTGMTDCLSGDPVFVGDGDYRLQASSPAKGAGLSGAGTKDLDNKNFANPPSIGCYEAGEPVPAHDHAWGEASYDWTTDYSSCTATAPCTVADCTETLSETVKSSYDVTKKPSVEEPGTGVYTATFTNPLFAQQTKEVVIPKIVPPHEHVWGEATYVWASDYATCTASASCTSGDCTETTNETATASYEIVTPATETSVGLGRYTVTFVCTLFAAQPKEVEIPATAVASQPSFGTYEKAIEFTTSGYKGSETLTDFPVLVRLGENSPTGFSYADADSDGSDIRFADALGNELPCEVETWNTSGESLIWVKLPSLDKTTKFTMYFKGQATTAATPTAVWNENYGAVWHMDEANGVCANSTANGSTYDATPAGDATKSVVYVGADAPIGNARTTANDGTKAYLSVPNYDALGYRGVFTMSGWVRLSTVTGYPRLFSRKATYQANDGWEIQMNSNSSTAYSARANGADSFTANFQSTVGADLKNNWVHIALVYNNNTLSVYGNGKLSQSGSVTSLNNGASYDNGLALSIGCNSNGSETHAQGAFDECRLMGGAASADWVMAEYQQGVAGSDFLSAGEVQQVGSPTVVANPKFSPAEGTVCGDTEVTIACQTDGATIRYTLDGTDPDENSEVYVNPIVVTASVTIKAIAFKEGLDASEIVSATYTYEAPVGPTLGAVTVTPKTTSAAISGSITSVGNNGATECDVYLSLNGAAATKLGTSAAGAYEYPVSGLTAETTYSYTLSISNNATTVMGAETSGSFTTTAVPAGLQPSGDPTGVIDRQSIQGAIDAAAAESPAGTVTLGEGTFYLDAELSVTGGVTLVGAGWDQTIVTPASGQKIRCVVVDGGATVEGMTLTGGNAVYGSGAWIKNGTVTWCKIINNNPSTNGDEKGVGVSFNSGKGQVDHCIIADNGSWINTKGIGIGASNPVGAITIDTCLIYGNKTWSTVGAGAAIGIYDHNFDCTVRNCTIVGNTASSDGAVYHSGGNGKLILVNDIVAGNFLFNGTEANVHQYVNEAKNCLFGLASEILTGRTDCLFGDPVFVGDGDYHLQASSPAKGAGLAGVGVKDLDNKNFANTPSIGCYEVHGSIAEPVFEFPTSRTAKGTLRLVALAGDATSAAVTFAYGLEIGDLGTPIPVAAKATPEDTLVVTLSDLDPLTSYRYCITATDDGVPASTYQLTGTFTTPDWNALALGAPTVTDVSASSARPVVEVKRLGVDATSASVTLSWGTSPSALSESRVLSASAVAGDLLADTISGLAANTEYHFAFTAQNNATPAETVTVTGSFWTADTSIAAGDRLAGYPDEIPSDKVVTYDADKSGDPVTFEPGQPFCVVNATGYPFVYESTVGDGYVYAFRNEVDFRYNASARIGDTYYLFLSDAVDASRRGDTIEVLRNNYAVGETMEISTKLTIHGNGHVVKVAEPFTDAQGFVNTNCTEEVKTVFHIANGGDVGIDNLTIMGGGEKLGPGSVGANDATTPAITVCRDVNGGSAQSGSTGILEIDHVTVTRAHGGLFIADGAKVYANACNLVRNARYCGGGLYNHGLLVMVNSSLSENRSLYSNGGGAAAENQGSLFMNNCVVCNNAATEYGGALNMLANTAVHGEVNCVAYLMNVTMAGNFSSNANDDGGGIAIHQNADELYMVNCILCNNYSYSTSSVDEPVTPSDIRVDGGSNWLYYSVYGTVSGASLAEEMVAFQNCWQVDESDHNVFKGYSPFVRTYEKNKQTADGIPSAALESEEGQPLARYAPPLVDGAADVGTAGVYTYFDASNWREWTDSLDVSAIKMSYKPANGSMTALGNCAPAEESDKVMTYYETAFNPNVAVRELGVIGASGFGHEKRSYTLYLLKQPENGSVNKELTLQGTSYLEGSEVTVVATPNAACLFVGWYDENDDLLSSSASYTFTMDSDKKMYALFTPPSPTRTFNVDCEQATEGTHGRFPITITTNWLAAAFVEICPDGIVPEEMVADVEEALNAQDDVNGLNHVWMNYVLGAMVPGDEDGRISIRADQTRDASTLRFRTHEFSQTQGCGFSVRFRLPAKTSADDGFVRGSSYSASSSFDAQISSDTLTHRVIDMIFVPDGYDTSCEYVTTVNTAGVMKVASSKKVEILGAPWVGFSPTNNPAVKATDYAKASCLSEGDVLYVYDRENQNYLAWAVQPDGTWAAVKTYILDNGVVTESAADATRTNDIPRGVGVWLERQDVTKPIFLYGQVDASPVVTSLTPGFNLVANPYPTAFDASKLVAPARTGDDGDHIVIPTGGAPINACYKDGGWGWYHDEEVEIVEGIWGVSSTWTTEGLIVPVGQGFWYLNSGTDAVELAWPTSAGGKDE